MNFIFFLFFLIVTLFYIWNGNDFFDKKAWLKFGLKFIFVLIGTFILGFILKGLAAVWSGLSNEMAGNLMVGVAGSFTSILGMKFLVVMACTMFGRIMDFHKNYNQKNYSTLSSLSTRFAPALLVLAKCLVSFGSVLIFYGIWLAQPNL